MSHGLSMYAWILGVAVGLLLLVAWRQWWVGGIERRLDRLIQVLAPGVQEPPPKPAGPEAWGWVAVIVGAAVVVALIVAWA